MDFSSLTYHFMLPMLEYFHKLFGHYGWAIITLTIIVKLILHPLTQKQTESMKHMQALQPKVKTLQERFDKQKERYKDRPAKLKEAQSQFQKEMMEFYQEHKVNPLGGWFPMLIQLPILIALFWSFNGSPFKPVSVYAPIEILAQENSLNEKRDGSSKAQIYVGNEGEKGRFTLNPGAVKITSGNSLEYKVVKLEGTVENLNPNELNWQILDTPYYAPGYMNKENISELATINKTPDGSITLTANRPGMAFIHAIFPASHANDRFLFINGLGKTGIVDNENGKLNFDVFVLVIMFIFTIWLSGKVTSASTAAPADAKQAEMQKMMQKMMPVMIGGMMMFFPVPSGVLLYFVVSGLIQALQTWLVMGKPETKKPSIKKEDLLDEKPKKEKTSV